MRKFVALAVIVFGMTALCVAQEVPQAEVFGGYSLFHFDKMDADSLFVPPPTPTINQNMHGWNAAVQFNINKWLGAVADFSGHYGTPLEISGTGDIQGSTYNMLFGPQINVRGKKAKGFAHVLFGVNRFKADASSSLGTPEFTDSAFALAFGGGVDVNVTKRIGVRLGQFDYIWSKHDFGPGFDSQNNFRFSAGILFNLGNKK